MNTCLPVSIFTAVALWVMGTCAGQAQQSATFTLSTERSQALGRAALADARVRQLIGPGDAKVVAVELIADKAEAEAYLEGRREAPPTAKANVLLWNRITGKAARASLETRDAKILGVTAVKLGDVPLIPEEVEEALALVKASPAAQKAIGDSLEKFHLVFSGEDASHAYIAQALPVRSNDSKDSCAIGHCLEFIFRVEQTYLPLRAHVDLVKRAVAIVGGGEHKESH